MLERVSQCAMCSAPIYLPPATEWVNGVPPLAVHTCNCAKAQAEMRQRITESMHPGATVVSVQR